METEVATTQATLAVETRATQKELAVALGTPLQQVAVKAAALFRDPSSGQPPECAAQLDVAGGVLRMCRVSRRAGFGLLIAYLGEPPMPGTPYHSHRRGGPSSPLPHLPRGGGQKKEYVTNITLFSLIFL